MTMTSSNFARRLGRDERGVSAIEFALIAPLILLVLAAVVDVGGLIYMRTQLEIAVSAATSHAMGVGQDLKFIEAELGQQAARIIVGRMGNRVDLKITLNKSHLTRFSAQGISQSGPASAADLCYCPNRGDDGIDWGEAQICRAPCPDGGRAGKFLAITASLPYTPLFFDYGVATPDGVNLQTMVALQ